MADDHLTRTIARQQADMVIGILEGFIPMECRKNARDKLAEVFFIHEARIVTDPRDEGPDRRSLSQVLQDILRCDTDGGGLNDGVDNHGKHYQSQFLADVLVEARAALSLSGADGNAGGQRS